MTNAKRRRSREARKRVERVERVKPTPETLAKLRPWTMRELLRLGPDAGGIDPVQHDNAVELVDAFRALTKELGFRPLDLVRVGKGTVGMGAHELRLATIYLAWGLAFSRRFKRSPALVVEWIEDEQPLELRALPILLSALDLWDRIKSDHDRAASVQRTHRRALVG